MQKQFIVSSNGFEKGPFEPEEILSQLIRKELQPVDYVYIEENQDWMMLAEFQSYLDSRNPSSSLIKDQPPALAPYPNVSEPKKEKLLKEVQKLRDQQVTNLPKEMYAAPEAKKSVPLLKTEKPPILETPINNSSSTASKAIQLKQGEASYSVPAEKAGELLLKLKSNQNLDLGGQLQVKVKSGHPEKVTWEGPSKKTVGEKTQFTLTAADQFGNLVVSYNGQMSLKWQGEIDAPTKIQFKNGIALLEFTTTKAQTISFEILASSEFPHVHLPTPAKVSFEAGPAEKLLLDGPQEVVAGEAIQVKIRAVDKYGNLAKLDTEVEIEVDTKTA